MDKQTKINIRNGVLFFLFNWLFVVDVLSVICLAAFISEISKVGAIVYLSLEVVPLAVLVFMLIRRRRLWYGE